MDKITPIMRRFLEHVRDTPRGGRSYNGYPSQLYAMISGMAVERGLVREVRRRDFTRDYRLTDAGREALAKKST